MKKVSNRRRYPLAALLAAAALIAPPTLAAQDADGTDAPRTPVRNSGWNAWVGCWEPVDARSTGSFPLASKSQRTPSRMLCVLPVPGTEAAEFVTVVAGEIAGRTPIDASGTKRERTVDECSGWESAAFSADRRRVYLHSEYTCPGNLQRRSSGVLAFAPGAQWIDVQGLTVEDQTATSVQRYRAVEPTPELSAKLPAELAAALERSQTLPVWTARSAASKPIEVDAVIDASRHADAAVVSAWLVELGQSFAINGKALRRLDNANVPDPVIDIMVALSYPTHFAINREGSQHPPTVAEAPPTNVELAPSAWTGILLSDRTSSIWDPYDPLGLWHVGWARMSYRPGYYTPSRYGYSFYSFYRLPDGSWYRVLNPVVVVPREELENNSRMPTKGRVVKGRGYTRSKPGTTPSPARTSRSKRPSAGSTATTNTKPESGSSTSSSSGSSSGSAGSTVRKAKPRGGS